MRLGLLHAAQPSRQFRRGVLVALKDTKGNGSADSIQRFGETMAQGGHGGTGIAIFHEPFP
jgi:hypothetical protein